LDRRDGRDSFGYHAPILAEILPGRRARRDDTQQARNRRMSANFPYFPYLLLAIAVGVLGGIHIPINGALGARLDSTPVATFAFYGVAFGLISLVCLVIWDRPAFTALASMPRWYYSAGVISVVVVAGSTFLIPRLGAINLFVIGVTSQLLVRMIISHFGWLESPVSPVTWVKLLGGVLLIAGAILAVHEPSAAEPLRADGAAGMELPH
jgi:transporter family-2 protein